MTAFTKEQARARTATDRELYQRQIDATDKQTARPAFRALTRWCTNCMI